MSRVAPIALITLMASGFSGLTHAARAGEISVAAGADYGVAPLGSRRIGGWGGGGELSYGLDDELSLTLGGHWVEHASDEGSLPFEVAYAAAGVRYAIDVLVVTPYVRTDAASYLRRPDGPAATAFSDWSVQGAVGLDWRAWERSGVGVEVRFHDMLARFSNRPAYVTLWISASFVLARFGDDRPPRAPDGSET